MRCLALLATLLFALPAAAQKSDVSPKRLAELQAMAKRVAKSVEKLRGLKFKKAVPVGVQTRKELSKFIKAEMEREMTPKKLAHDNALARKVGLIPANADLGKIYAAVLGENVGGFYLPQKRKLFLVADPGDSQKNPGAAAQKMMLKMIGMSEEEMAAVHELTHALDDQHFEALSFQIDKIQDEDRMRALQCAYEGTANVVMYDHLLAKMGQDSSSLANQDMFGQTMRSAQAPAIDKAPRYVKAGLLAPYTIGLRFVANLKKRGGWKLVNKMYSDPPTSMEQILHIEKYLDRDVATEVTLTGLDAAFAKHGYAKVGEQTLGEFLIRELLQDRLGKRDVAARAAAGWDGDRYAVYRNKETKQLALALVAVFDTEKDAEQFVGAYELLHRAKYPTAKPHAIKGVFTDASGSHSIARAGTRVHILESVPAAALSALDGQLGKATLTEKPGGLPKVPKVKRLVGLDGPEDVTEGLSFSAVVPEGWKAERAAYADARYPLTLNSEGATIKVGVLPGNLTPEMVAERVAAVLPKKLDDYREAPRGALDMLPAGAKQLNYSGVANAEEGRRRYTQVIFALGGKTYMLILTAMPGRGARAKRAALGEFVRSFKPRK